MVQALLLECCLNESNNQGVSIILDFEPDFLLHGARASTNYAMVFKTRILYWYKYEFI